MLPPKLIVSPIDFSSHAQEALQTAADLAKQFGSELLLVHAVPLIPKLPSTTSIFHEAEFERELHKDAERRLQELAAELTKKGLRVRTETGTANDVAMEILRIAEHNSADLIVIATHGMTGWHRLVFGSVAEKVVRLASCPVLVLRANPQEAKETSGKTAHSGGRAGAVSATGRPRKNSNSELQRLKLQDCPVPKSWLRPRPTKLS